MSNGFKQFHKYYVKNLEINEIEWDTFSWGQLFELIYDDASIQIYPDKVLKYMVNHTELKEYDRRCDGKRYFCTGFHSNGFTPKTIIGTVRGNINRLYELVDKIIDYRENQIRSRMNEVIGAYNNGIDFDFYDFDCSSICVYNLQIMEDEDELLEDAVNVFKEFDLDVEYEWDYDAGSDWDSRMSMLNFKIIKN